MKNTLKNNHKIRNYTLNQYRKKQFYLQNHQISHPGKIIKLGSDNGHERLNDVIL